MNNKTLKIVITIISIVLVAGLGSILVAIGNPWFESLIKPAQWIPSFVIPIIWSIIYITFGTILVLWQLKENLPLSTSVFLVINGTLNVLWCLIFFTLKQTFIGNITIIINLIAGFWLVIDIMKRKQLYGYILTIYPLWLSIATTLNIALWILN